MAINSVWEAQISYQLGSTPTLNVLHFKETVSIIPNTGILPSQCVAEAMYDVVDAIMEVLSVDAKCVSIYVREADAPAIPTLVAVTGAEVNGGQRAGQACPPQAAQLYSLYTGTNTKSGRGRVFIPGTSETDQEDGRVTEELFGLMGTLATFLKGERTVPIATAGKIKLGVWSRKNLTIDTVLSVVAHPNLATQRGRRATVGFAP